MKEQFLNLSGLIDLVTYMKLCIAQHKVIIPRASFSLFPETGDENNIYIDTSTNAIYRWNDTDKKFVLLAKPPRTIAISEGTNNGEITLKVDNIASNAKVHGLTSTAFTESNKFATAAQGAKADSAVQTITLSSGTKNGTIKIKVNNITTDNIEVAGLGSAAFSDIGIFAAKSHTHKKDEVGLGNVDNTADIDKSVKYATSAGAVSWKNITDKPTLFPPQQHNHDSLYYRKNEVDSLLSGKSDTGHTHVQFIQEVKFSNGTYSDPLNGTAVAIKASGGIASDLIYEGGKTLADKYQAKGSYAAASHKQAYTSGECTTYNADDNTMGVTPAAVKKAFGIFGPKAHTHKKSDITDFPTSLPASDVYGWAKASSKPSYTKSEVGLGNVDNTADANKSVKYAGSSGSSNTVVYTALTNTDLNTLQTEGRWYYAGGGNTCTNIPVASAAFELYVGRNASGWRYQQFTVTSGEIYIRVFDSSNWGSWRKLAFTSDTVTAASSVPWSGITGKPTTFTPASHTHNYAGSSSAGGTANASYKLSNVGQITTVDALNNFNEANVFKYATMSALDGLNGLGKNDGIILSAPWSSANYGHQIFLDDNSYTIAHRYRSSGTWSAWKTLIDSSNIGSQSVSHASTADSATTATQLSSSAGSATQPVYFSGGKPVATTYTLGKSVPSNAVFTDTNTWRGIQNNLTSDSTTDSLSAAQGKVLKGLVDGKAASSHTHAIAQISNLQSTLDGKSNTNHTHDLNQMINTLTNGTSDPVDTDYYIAQYAGGGSTTTTYHRRPHSALWNYIKSKANSVYQPKGSYAASSHTHDDRYYTESEINTKLASKSEISHTHNYVVGSYTGNGGLQKPNYFGTNKVGFLMMNATVNGDSNYKDWIIMDCYSGTDVGGGVAFGVNRQKLGAYIMRSTAARTAWVESAELLHTQNYTSYTVTKTGSGASGTWGISISGNAATASSVPWSGVSGKPSSYPPSSHTHSYLPLSGGSLSGSFHSKPTASGSYNENIRIHPSPSNWTSIVMCGDDNTGDSGTSAKTWGIFTHNGVFGISKNGNGDSTLGPASLRCDTSNIWYINGNTILHSANYNSYAPTKTGGGASGTWSISVSGNAATATKLATARSITLGGLSSGSANFDGSGNITIDDWGYGVTKYINKNSTSTPYTRIAYASADYSWYDGSMVFVIDSGYANGGYGIIKVCMRSNDIRTKDNSTCEVRWLVRQGFSAEQIFIKGYAPENGTQYADLYFKANGTYNAITIRVLSSGGRGNRLRTWTFDGSASRANPDIRTYSYTVTGCDSGTANYANSAGVASKLNNITADWSGQISSTSWFAAFNPSTAGELRAISIANVKSVLGISNVNNTADANKSVKYATSAGSAGSVAWGNVSGRPSSLPASDVYAWAKASTKPSYSYTEITNRPTLIKAVSKNGYWGMADHDGSDSNWIRTTTAGIIPYQSGGAGGGHCGIGTSSWYFSNAYIDTVNCVNTNASGYLQANGLINTFSEYQSQRGKRDWRFGSATGTGDQNWFGFYDYTSGYHGGIYGPDHLLRMGGEIQSTAANGFRAVQGNYGFIIRNDGANVYFMMTGNGDPWGGWNDNYTIFTPNGEWQIKKSPYDNGMSTSRGYVVVSDSNADRVYSISNNANYLKVRGGLNTYHCTYSNSDIRLKKNINNTSITNALSVINSIKVRQFDWKETNIHQSIGFVADELEKLDPNFSQGGGVTKDGGIDVKSVNSFYLQGYIVKALQELSSQVSDLKQENKRLKQKLNMCN